MPSGVVCVGRGHHSHRLPVTQWASPFVLMSGLPFTWSTYFPACREGKTVACDCPLDCHCEGDVLAGLVFDAGRPRPKPHPSASGRPRPAKFSRNRWVMMAAAASLLPTPVGAVIPYLHQDSVVSAFSSLFPDDLLHGFHFPMIEDLVNAPPFSDFTLILPVTLLSIQPRSKWLRR